jgi:hypothetical protein
LIVAPRYRYGWCSTLKFEILKFDLKFPRIKTLHQLVKNLESKSSVIEPLKLGDEEDRPLGSDVLLFANTEREKELILDGVEYLLNQGFPGDGRGKLLKVLNEDSFYRGFPELATYGWLERHSIGVKPQVEVKYPDVLNPNGCSLDGILLPYEVAFDIKSFGLATHLANKLVRDLETDFTGRRVKLDGRMDVDTKTVETDALRQREAIAKELRAGREYKIPSLGWRLSVMRSAPVNTSTRSWGPYRQAEELRFYPFKQAAQFTTTQPFMLVFSYLPRLNPFLRETETDFTDKFFRTLARRVFLGRENEGTPLSQYDKKSTEPTARRCSPPTISAHVCRPRVRKIPLIFKPTGDQSFPWRHREFYLQQPSAHRHGFSRPLRERQLLNHRNGTLRSGKLSA